MSAYCENRRLSSVANVFFEQSVTLKKTKKAEVKIFCSKIVLASSSSRHAELQYHKNWMTTIIIVIIWKRFIFIPKFGLKGIALEFIWQSIRVVWKAANCNELINANRHCGYSMTLECLHLDFPFHWLLHLENYFSVLKLFTALCSDASKDVRFIPAFPVNSRRLRAAGWSRCFGWSLVWEQAVDFIDEGLCDGYWAYQYQNRPHCKRVQLRCGSTAGGFTERCDIFRGRLFCSNSRWRHFERTGRTEYCPVSDRLVYCYSKRVEITNETENGYWWKSSKGRPCQSNSSSEFVLEQVSLPFYVKTAPERFVHEETYNCL